MAARKGTTMLPDFIAIKEEAFNSVILEAQRRLYGEQSLASAMSKFKIHEGSETVIIRQDGSQKKSKHQTHEAEFELSAKDIESQGFDSIAKAIKSMNEQFTEQIDEGIISQIEEAVEQTGNKIDAGGRPLEEVYLDMVEKLPPMYDHKGRWYLPSLIINPQQQQKFEAAMRRLQQDPNLYERLNDILRRKKEEWYAREAHRKLVD